MGVFGKTATIPAKNTAKESKAPAANGPVMTLRVKGSTSEKSEYLTGLFIDKKQPDEGKKLSGKDREGNRFTVFLNADGSGNLYYTPSGAQESVKLTGLFLNNEGKFGPYLSGKTTDGDRFYVAETKPKS